MSFSFSPPCPPCSRAMSSRAGVSIRWYPNRRYTVVIDSSTWSLTATLAGSRSLVPRAGLLSIFTAQYYEHSPARGPQALHAAQVPPVFPPFLEEATDNAGYRADQV